MSLPRQILSLAECFRDYSERFPKKENSKERGYLGEFIKADQSSTVRRWLTGEKLPTGERKWRAICFFEKIGYCVSERTALLPVYWCAIELFAFDIVSAEAIATGGFNITGIDPKDSLLKRIERNAKMTSKKACAVFDVESMYEEELGNAKRVFYEKYGDVMLSVLEVPSTQQKTPVPVVGLKAVPDDTSLEKQKNNLKPKITRVESTQLSHQTVLLTLGHLINGIIPLAGMVASDTFSRDERAQLRALTGDDGIFRLSNLFEQLCGERARKQN